MSAVLDTCALLFWTHAPQRLSIRAAHALDRLGRYQRGVVCCAAFWEIALKHKAGRLVLGMSPTEYLSRVRRLPVDIAPIDAALWLDSVALQWSHRDPVDRLVVALASREGLGIITSDEAIRAWRDDVIW